MTNITLQKQHRTLWHFIPGLALSAVITGVALWGGSIPAVAGAGFSALTLAILLGMVLGNTIYPHIWKSCDGGVLFAKQYLLRLGIILYGFRLTFSQIADVGISGIIIDVLTLSATPIPRTLGLLIYGDLDISILDELPPGRTPVKTRCITGKKRRDLYHFLDQEIGRGRQVYLVCPAIEDVPDGGLNAVKTYYEDIAKALLPDRRVGLMHGKLKPKEKAAVMEDFKAGRLDALVSTTVIEVGVDVPNATLMVIEDADRFGLSQLHQLRGRVGRGKAKSYCILTTHNRNPETLQRLKALCKTTDGFKIAEEDLRLRGPGDFFGSRQSGLPAFRVADLGCDLAAMKGAQQASADWIDAYGASDTPEANALRERIGDLFARSEGTMN